MADPSPYRPAIVDLLAAGTQDHRYRVEAVTPDGETLTLIEGPLDPDDDDTQSLSVTLTYDEQRAPRCSASVTIPIPDSRILDRLDPRTPTRLRFYAGYVHPDGYADVRFLADLSLQDRDTSRPDDTVQLLAESDEAVCIADAAITSTATVTWASVQEAIKALVASSFATARTWVDTTTGATSTTVELANADRWDLIEDLADRIDADVWVDGNRVWHLEPRTNTTGTVRHELTTGEAGTVLSARSTISRRGEFANRVYLVHDWIDAANANHRVTAVRQVTSGPFTAAPGNYATVRVTRDTPTTQAAANSAAASLVKRKATRGRSYTVDAVAAYWLRPTHTVNLTLPAGYPEDHLVASVSYALHDGSMSLTTRVPDTAPTIGAPA